MVKICVRRKSGTSHVRYADFRARLAAYMDKVCDGRAPLHVTRKDGRAVVVIAKKEFDSWMATLHLLRSPGNTRRLLASIRSANARKRV